ncbi:MAG: ammonium transporter [Campylobacterales bacterium]
MLWIILCAFLIFLMQLGFSLIETGTVRSKNTINVAMKNLIDTVFGIIFFWLIGFGLMFGLSSNGIVGTNLFAMDGSNMQINSFFFFQSMFAATAVTIISGAVAERMKFNGYIVVAILVTSFIYPIFGHWVWNDGGWLNQLGFTDFAGSTVVHSIGAWVGLIGAIILGPRLGRFSKGKIKYFAPSNHNFIVFGVFILIFAWFGFNGGSLLEFNDKAALVLTNTLIGGAFGGLAGWIISLFSKTKVDVEIFAFGIIAGLVGITAGADQFSIYHSAFVGFSAAIIMYVSDQILLKRFFIDDPLSVVSIHGFAGAWGTLTVGFFVATPLGLSRIEFIFVQLLGIATAFVFAIVLGAILFYILYKLNLLRVQKKHEVLGLNVSEHNAKLPWVETIESIVKIMKTGNIQKKVHEERGTEVGLVAKFFNYLLNILRNEQVKLKKSNINLQKESQFDQLTQILNRRGLQEMIKDKNPFKEKLCLIIIDIDKFKPINDTYGHSVGDSVLKELCELITKNLREDDVFARWGGEEFVLVVHTNDFNAAQNIAEKLRVEVEKHKFTTVNEITASFGVSHPKSENDTFDQLFDHADQALYQAKELGRNRVCTW